MTRAQTPPPLCECTGNAPAPDKREGGDGQPLRWSSIVRQIASSQSGPLYCYERRVENRSGREVTDVYWPIAAYRKSSIDKTSALCDPISMLGVVNQPDPTGPLTYNTGPNPYATTVRAPGAGWGKTTAGQRTGLGPALTSAVQIPVSGVGVATVRFTSTVRREGAFTIFRFEMTSQGPDVRVFWNVPVTDGFAQLEFTPNAPPTLAAGRALVREVRSIDQVAIAVADVHAYTNDMRWLGSGAASAYVSAEGKSRTPINIPPPPGGGALLVR
jgi:hypothetical protein